MEQDIVRKKDKDCTFDELKARRGKDAVRCALLHFANMTLKEREQSVLHQTFHAKTPAT